MYDEYTLIEDKDGEKWVKGRGEREGKTGVKKVYPFYK